jgi:hypothetical protein
MIEIIASFLIAQQDICRGLTPKDSIEIDQKVQEAFGRNDQIMFVVFGGIQPSEDYPAIVFCQGSDTTNIHRNPDYKLIQLTNQKIELYIKVKDD